MHDAPRDGIHPMSASAERGSIAMARVRLDPLPWSTACINAPFCGAPAKEREAMLTLSGSHLRIRSLPSSGANDEGPTVLESNVSRNALPVSLLRTG